MNQNQINNKTKIKRQVVLDTETTGLHPYEGHRIIEIGCIEMIDRRVTGKQLHYYFNMDKKIDDGAVAVHGITNDFLKDKPLFSDKVDEIMDFLSGAELIIHNAPFDVGFIDSELQKLPKESKYFKNKLSDHSSILDTLVLAKKKYPRQRNSLDALCKRLKIDNSNRSLHGALLDSDLLAQVFLAMTGGQLSLFDKLSGSKSSAAERLEDKIDINNRLDSYNKSLKKIKLDDKYIKNHDDHLKVISKENKIEPDDFYWES